MYSENESIALIGLLKLSKEGKPQPENINKPKNPLQTSTLEKIFIENKFPSEDLKKDAAILLNLSHRTIQIWFQNRRQRYKNELKQKLTYSRRYRDMPRDDLNEKINTIIDKEVEKETPLGRSGLIYIYVNTMNTFVYQDESDV